MAGDTLITVVGNLTGDPELRFTPSGAPVANFTVASTPRKFDKTSNEWKDGETLFMRCSIWRDAAENATESLTKGCRVIATGHLVSRSWEKDGQRQTGMEMQVEEIGPSLKSATAKVAKTERSNAAQGAQQSDPWQTQPQASNVPQQGQQMPQQWQQNQQPQGQQPWGQPQQGNPPY